jgi:uncharacterized protein YdiU (UPF0061 family)
MATLENLPFDNRYARLPDDFFARVAPTPFAHPHLVAANPDAAALIGLDAGELARPEFGQSFSGGRALPGADPIAMLYAGHQFGTWVPQLGDGRALLLGEVEGPDGTRWDLHLKGAGKTPFSRDGDGRAVLRSTVREYLCSEAMHGLGVPTTRALCIVGSDEPVRRERIETAAMMVRLSPSHVRFGTFQVFASRKRHDHLKTLADHVIAEHFPDLSGASDAYSRLLAEIAARTGRLVARWQTDGFVHGVLNSDNMSVLGVTIDYGPFAFIDAYRHDYVRNHTDHTGFYAYGRQPDIGRFNVYLLAHALMPLMDEAGAEAGFNAYGPAYNAAYDARMREKLGLAEAREDDPQLVTDLFAVMDRGGADFALFFRGLSAFRPEQVDAVPPALLDLLAEPAHRPAAEWFGRYAARIRSEKADPGARAAAMDRVNPLYVLRTHLAQAAIDKAEAGDFSEIERLRALLADPYTPRETMAAYAAPPPKGAPQPMLSCSS